VPNVALKSLANLNIALAVATIVLIACPNNDGHNKSLDASGGGVFRIMTGPAMLD
jgi:hypothetical protein